MRKISGSDALLNREEQMKILKALAVMLAAGFATTAHAGNVNVVYATYGPTTSSNVQYGIIPFLEIAKKRSGGTINYTIHSGGSLLSAKAMLGGLKNGIADGGEIIGVYFPSELPVSNLAMNLAPTLRKGGPALAAAITEYILVDCAACRREFKQNNVVFLGAYATSPYGILCREPVSNLESLKGKKVRVPGDFAYIATQLGMTPVNMSISDTYEGLQRGALDCTLGPLGWLKQFSLGDVAKNVLDLRYGTSYGGPIISLTQDLWSRLDEKQKKAFEYGAAIGMFRAAKEYIAFDEQVRKNAAADGYKIVEPDQGIENAMKPFDKSYDKRLIERANKSGIKNAAEVVNGFKATLVKWQGIMAKVGDNEDAFANAMMTNVYSKM